MAPTFSSSLKRFSIQLDELSNQSSNPQEISTLKIPWMQLSAEKTGFNQNVFEALQRQLCTLLEKRLSETIAQAEHDEAADLLAEQWTELLVNFGFADLLPKYRLYQQVARDKRQIRLWHRAAEALHSQAKELPRQFPQPDNQLVELTRLVDKLASLSASIANAVKQIPISAEFTTLQTQVVDWLTAVQENEKSLRRRTVGSSTLAALNQYSELSVAIDEAIQQQEPFIRSFRSDNLDDSSIDDLPPRDAKGILGQRWINFSVDKYQKYIREAKRRVPDNPPYLEPPDVVQKEFTNQLLDKNLRMISELGERSKQILFQTDAEKKRLALASQTVEAIAQKIRSAKLIEDRLNGVKTLQGCEVDVQKIAPCLLTEYEQSEKLLLGYATDMVNYAWAEACDRFAADQPTRTAQFCREWAGRLELWTVFAKQQEFFEALNQLATDLEIFLQHPPSQIENARETCLIFEKRIQDHPLNATSPKENPCLAIPIQLTRLKLALNADAALAQAEQCLPKDTKQAQTIATALVQENYDLLEAALSHLDAKHHAAQIQRLKNLQNNLHALLNYCWLREELSKKGANLNTAHDYLKIATANKWLSSLLGKELTRHRERLTELAANDPQVDAAIKAAQQLLSDSNKLPISYWLDMSQQLQSAALLASTHTDEVHSVQEALHLRILSVCDRELRAVVDWADQAPNLVYGTEATWDVDQVKEIHQWLTTYFPNIDLVSGLARALNLQQALEAEKKQNWESAITAWLADSSINFTPSLNDETQLAPVHLRALACLKILALQQAVVGNYLWLNTAQLRGLENDPDIKLAEVQKNILDVRALVEEPAKLRLEQSKRILQADAEFHKAQVLLSEIQQTTATNINNTAFQNSWQRNGYRACITIINALTLQRQIEFLTRQYTQYFRVTRKVEFGERLGKLRTAMRLASHWPLTGDDQTTVDKLWVNYRNAVLSDFDAADFESGQGIFIAGRLFCREQYSTLCAWALAPSRFSLDNIEQRRRLEVIISQFVTLDLENRTTLLTTAERYTPHILQKAKLDWESDEENAEDLPLKAAGIHAEALSHLEDDIKDLVEILTSHAVDDQTTLGKCRIKLDDSQQGLLQKVVLMKQRVENLYQFSRRLKGRLKVALSLSDKSRKKFIDIQNEWNLVHAPWHTEQHPTIPWVTEQITYYLDYRNKVEICVNQIADAYHLDAKWGARWKTACLEKHELVQKVSLSATIEAFCNVQQSWSLGWVEFAFECFKQLPILDRGNLTNWKEYIQFGIHEPDKLEAYLRKELDLLKALRKTTDDCLNCQPPGLPPIFKKALREANYEQALGSLANWLGYISNANELSKRKDEIEKWLQNQQQGSGLDKSAVFPPNSLGVWAIQLNDLLGRCPPPTEEASQTRQDWWKELQMHQARLAPEFTQAVEALAHWDKLSQIWPLRKGELDSAERTHFKETTIWHKLLKHPERNLGRVFEALRNCYAIAPDNPDINSRIDFYGASATSIRDTPLLLDYLL